ncbi:MAG: trehalase family glycosidase [Pseudomonadota bacterium]
MFGDRLIPLLRRIASALRRRTKSMAALATRFNRVLFYIMDLVFWSRLIRSQRGPIPVELPSFVLRLKGVEVEAPVLHVSGLQEEVAHWDDGFAGVYAELFENLQTPDVLSSVRYGHPAPAFRGIYLWDSAFIAQVWKPWDRDVAHEVAEAVIRLRDGDRLQHVVSDLVASAYTQPPLIAWSLVRIWEGDVSRAERVAPVFGTLEAYHRWLRNNRRLTNGLYFWAHPYESGVENSPRFSSADEKVLRDTRQLAAPDLCAYMILHCEALAQMARWIGQDASDYESEADQLRGLVRRELWHEDDGLFYDRDPATGGFVRSRTIASLLPLWAGVPDADQARRMRDCILAADGFNAPMPLPSVALGDPDFAKDMWRGPVWLNTAYGVLEGLKRYGYEREASELAFRLCDAVYRIYRRERRFYEFYDPLRLDFDELHRKQGNRWKAFTLGTKPQPDFIGWTGLVNTLVIEQFFGFHRREGARYLQPRFPAAATGLGFSLRLPGEDLSLDVAVLQEETLRVSIRTRAGVREEFCGFGQPLAIDSHPEHGTSQASIVSPLHALL